MELNELAENFPEKLSALGANYDPDVLAEMFRSRRGELNARALVIASTLGGFISSIARDWATGQLEQNEALRGKQLTAVLTNLGPSFVKLGQALSLRPDLLPKAYLEALAQLQDGMAPFHSDIAFTVIEQELGKPLEHVFSHITPKPVAAASLGQVYKATLAATGDTVAVKDIISQELTPLVDEFAGRLFGELDYEAEGRNCERFTELYANLPRIRTPSIYWQATSRRVLTMEWIDGVKLTNKPAMDAAGQSITDFVDVGIECTLRQLLEHGYFHADPHPGNLLATPEGDLCYLDFGMMAEAPAYARTALIAHVVHLVNRDYDAMCRDYYTLQFMDPSIDTSPIAPALATFFDSVLDRSVSELNFKAIVDGLGDVLFKYPFQVPAYYALILRSLTVLEGVALSADSNYKLLAKAYPYMAQRLLTDPDPELRGTFEELMLQSGQIRWKRLQDLVRQSQKSQGFNPQQIWLIADWFLSDNAKHIRSKVVEDLVRMADARIAAGMRQRVHQQSGSEALARRMVPLSANEARYAETAAEIEAALMPAGTPSPFAMPQLSSSGMPDPRKVQQYIQEFVARLDGLMPRMRSFAAHPEAQNMARDLISQVLQRCAARSVRFVFAGAGLPART